MTQTTAKAAARKMKPAKPYADFPLFPHDTGRWAKKIRGKLVYFGKWDDWQGALAKYQEQRDDLHAGRTPRVAAEGVTVADLCNRFLTAKRHLVDTSEITARTFADYYQSCARVVDVFGRNRLVVDLAADDFEHLRKQTSKTRGVVALGNEITRIRVLFKYGYDTGLIDRPVRYGPTFKRPSKKTLRKARHAKGPRMFEAAELRRLIAAAGVPLRAMILLGINAGMGNNDVATLPLSAVDLKRGWNNYPRPKTGVNRHFPLWPETISALQAAIDQRRTPKEENADDLLFVTKQGKSWSKAPRLSDGNGVQANNDNPVSKETRKLLDTLGLHRPGLGFYALRHTFETVAGESKDQVAVDHVMGHADASTGGRRIIARAANDDLSWLTPPEVARRVGVNADKVLSWIRSGRLKTINTNEGGQASGKGRPGGIRLPDRCPRSHRSGEQTPGIASLGSW